MTPINHQTQLIKNLKPSEIEAHLKYKCPACEISHWISLKEASTRGFIIVCECNVILKPKLITDLRIKYEKKKTITKIEPIEENISQDKSETIEIKESEIKEPPKLVPPKELFDSCVPVLQNYGFTQSEASELIDKTYQQHSSCNLTDFIKYCLKNIPLENNDL